MRSVTILMSVVRNDIETCDDGGYQPITCVKKRGLGGRGM